LKELIVAIERDVAIVGAGPAGLTAAAYLAAQGLRVSVVDEYYRPGGRLLGQRYENPRKPPPHRLWNGERIASDLEARARWAGAELIVGTSVWDVAPQRAHAIRPYWHLALSGGTCDTLTARALLIATGCAERAVPIPGWTLPGVMSIGAAQTFTNLHGIRPGARVVVAGIDVLALSVAREMAQAGVEVVGIALPPPGPPAGAAAVPAEVVGGLASAADLAPSLVLRLGAHLFGGRLRHIGAVLGSIAALRVWGIPLHLGKAVMRIEGHEQVESVVLASIGPHGKIGREEAPVPVDAVCISGGLYPLIELVGIAGCPLVEIADLGGRVPLHAPDMRTPVEGLFLAGNIVGVEGATVAMAQGAVAGTSIASYLGVGGTRTAAELATAQAQVERARAEAPLTFFAQSAQGRAQLAQRWTEEVERRAAGPIKVTAPRRAVSGKRGARSER
jgi:sarcosine oxidase subunit alpha